MTVPQHLTDFLDSRPSIKVTHRSDPEFESTKQIFIDTPDVPLLMARPKDEQDVAALVSHLSSTSTPLVVRAGGHDLSARSVAQDAVQIDLRGFDHVRVADDKKTARIGGGILTQGLLDGLAAHGLMTAVGNASWVGWSSWAMNGGYGIMAGMYGLGCDQIVGAKVVLANGSLVDADERLLKAIRGAGPAFGVIVELQIKVYPLTEITSGLISFTGNIQETLKTYFDNCRTLMDSVKELPAELYYQPMVMAVPGAGPMCVLQFVWGAPPCDEQAEWLQKIADLVPGSAVAVKAVTPGDYTRELSKMLDNHVIGGETRTVSMRSLVPSPDAAAVIVKNAPLITAEYGAVFLHMVHGSSVRPDTEHPPSVFASREVHLMIEILGFSWRDEASKEPAAEWCKTMYEEIRAAEGVMDEAYFPLTKSTVLQLDKTYKREALGFLKELKQELDPNNVFCNPMPLAV